MSGKASQIEALPMARVCARPGAPEMFVSEVRLTGPMQIKHTTPPSTFVMRGLVANGRVR